MVACFPVKERKYFLTTALKQEGHSLNALTKKISQKMIERWGEDFDINPAGSFEHDDYDNQLPRASSNGTVEIIKSILKERGCKNI